MYGLRVPGAIVFVPAGPAGVVHRGTRPNGCVGEEGESKRGAFEVPVLGPRTPLLIGCFEVAPLEVAPLDRAMV